MRFAIKKPETEKVFHILKEVASGLKIIWSKKNQEYTKMIKSGCIYNNARVLRDLYRNTTNPNRSYTERVIYETALQNVAMELIISLDKTEEEMSKFIQKTLSKYHETFSEEHGIDLSDIIGTEEAV